MGREERINGGKGSRLLGPLWVEKEAGVCEKGRRAGANEMFVVSVQSFESILYQIPYLIRCEGGVSGSVPLTSILRETSEEIALRIDTQGEVLMRVECSVSSRGGIPIRVNGSD